MDTTYQMNLGSSWSHCYLEEKAVELDKESVGRGKMFQESPCWNFKYFYKSYLQQYSQSFPKYRVTKDLLR